MCGIIGICGGHGGGDGVGRDILAGLQRLEYRGYDSAGMALLHDNKFQRLRARGKLENLVAQFNKKPLRGLLGIGHTRWATHGIANEENAHPHMGRQVALVHNGIIENYQQLKDSLPRSYQQRFASETDTEVLVHVLDYFLDSGLDPVAAVQKMLPLLQGAFAFVAIFVGHDNLMIGARRGSPLAIGYGKKNGDQQGDGGKGGKRSAAPDADADADGAEREEMFLGSDALSLSHLTDRVSFLEEGDWVVLSRQGCVIYDMTGRVVKRAIHQSRADAQLVSKGNYAHFMLKEIHEQPSVVGVLLQQMVNRETHTITLPNLTLKLGPKQLQQIHMAACGTAFYAGLVAKYWCEQLVGIPFHCDLASEIRYRQPPFLAHSLGLVVSQSGETMDSLEALRFFIGRDLPTLAVVNVEQSTIAREANAVLFTHAGPEIGVASTKAFTTQLVVLLTFLLAVLKARQTQPSKPTKKNNKDISKKHKQGAEQQLVQSLLHLPFIMNSSLQREEDAKKIAAALVNARSVLYLGRGRCYPLALEGALKLKEISYIHAEGYAAGEMKHGPIALIEEGLPIIAIIPHDELFEKNISNIQEVIARGGVVFALTDQSGQAALQKRRLAVKGFYTLPDHDPLLSPLVFSIPIQLIAYHTALLKKRDVDQPRNLAKSVTVE